jgi:hypothetical protein
MMVIGPDQGEDKCWGKSKAIPVLANKDISNDQLKGCAMILRSMLMPKPLGAFVTSSTEQLDAIYNSKMLFVCGNNPGKTDNTGVTGLPFLPYIKEDGAFAEGGGAEFQKPMTYGEISGMCQTQASETANSGLPGLGANFKDGGERYGGHVVTEEYGHSIFDNAIASFDPQGWLAVQRAESLASADQLINVRDEDWDCYTAATEYIAAGVEMLLYGTRIGKNHKATTRTELQTKDPYLWCLALRWYESDNTWKPCQAGAADRATAVENTVNCEAKLKELGVTTFGPNQKGSGFKGGKRGTDSGNAKCVKNGKQGAGKIKTELSTKNGEVKSASTMADKKTKLAAYQNDVATKVKEQAKGMKTRDEKKDFVRQIYKDMEDTKFQDSDNAMKWVYPEYEADTEDIMDETTLAKFKFAKTKKFKIGGKCRPQTSITEAKKSTNKVDMDTFGTDDYYVPLATGEAVCFTCKGNDFCFTQKDDDTVTYEDVGASTTADKKTGDYVSPSKCVKRFAIGSVATTDTEESAASNGASPTLALSYMGVLLSAIFAVLL